MPVTYRPATRTDVPLILHFIRELADYEKLLDQVTATEDILTATMFGDKPKSYALLAEVDGQPAGFALYFYNFSTFLGKPGLYIEDVYVSPEYRGHGLGKGFFTELARKAVTEDCGRMEWWVLDWNTPAIDFYGKLGAMPMSEWTVQRLTRDQLEKLAA